MSWEEWEMALDRAEDEGYYGWNEKIQRAKEIMSQTMSTWLSMRHTHYLKTEEWRMKQLEILKRDNYVCQDCVKVLPQIIKKFNLQQFGDLLTNFKMLASVVHHNTYDTLRTPLEIEDCVSLCPPCHTLKHSSLIIFAEERRNNEILKRIHTFLLKQPAIIKEAQRQHNLFIKSITIKPREFKGV